MAYTTIIDMTETWRQSICVQILDLLWALECRFSHSENIDKGVYCACIKWDEPGKVTSTVPGT